MEIHSFNKEKSLNSGSWLLLEHAKICNPSSPINRSFLIGLPMPRRYLSKINLFASDSSYSHYNMQFSPPLADTKIYSVNGKYVRSVIAVLWAFFKLQWSFLELRSHTFTLPYSSPVARRGKSILLKLREMALLYC